MKKALSLILAIVLLVTLTGSVCATGFSELFGRHIIFNSKAIVIIPGLGGTSL